MSRLSNKVLALVAAGASAVTIATQFLHEREGVRLKPYRDGSGLWTNCMGNTKNVDPRRTMTEAECEAIDKRNVEEAAAIVDVLVTVPMTNAEKASVISFCAFNVGPGKCASSTFLRKLNSGDREGACNEYRRWIRDGGKDCRVRSNNCYGQIERREMERELCLM